MEIPKNCEGCLASCVCETTNVPGCDECVEFHKLVEEKLICPNCKGDGKYKMSHAGIAMKVTCHICGGTGKL